MRIWRSWLLVCCALRRVLQVHALEHDPELKRGNRQPAFSQSVHPGFWRLPMLWQKGKFVFREFMQKWDQMQQEFGSVCVFPWRPVHLKVIIHSYHVIMILTHYQGCFGNWGITSVIYPYFLGSIASCFHIDSPLYFCALIHDVLNTFIFRAAKIICFGGFLKIDSLWMCYFIAYMFL